MTGDEYFGGICESAKKVAKNLSAKGVQARYLGFGGEGIKPEGKPRVPSGGVAEFFANRAMGDWAEERLAATMRETFAEWIIAQYGDTGRLVAGDADFKEYYIFGLEALTYMRVREEQRKAGKKPGRMTPSFTVKVEDLIIVYRWIERYRVPEAYFQVFFDTIFAINFTDIFRIIAGNTNWQIEAPAKSQEKATIMIPITCGQQVGRVTKMPDFTAEQRITPLGRHDAYVVPVGGEFVLDSEKTAAVLNFGSFTSG